MIQEAIPVAFVPSLGWSQLGDVSAPGSLLGMSDPTVSVRPPFVMGM